MAHSPISAAPFRSPAGRKYFSVEEANRALPYVGRIVDDITNCYQHAVATRQRIERPHTGDKLQSLKHTYEQAMDRLNELIEELQQVGVELKDFERGLVDFPAWIGNREIYLCWLRSEQAVNHWHEVDTGYAARQPLATLEAAA